MKTIVRYKAYNSYYCCLYPTFKEWKLLTPFASGLKNKKVYILPLRNENWVLKTDKTAVSSGVYILPLRNENNNFR